MNVDNYVSNCCRNELNGETPISNFFYLLNVFWSIHNPTTKNRQGWDIGSQYRSLIPYHTPEQESLARESKEKLENSGKFRGRGIVTEIISASTFYKAEDYHQKYYQKAGGGGCRYL